MLRIGGRENGALRDGAVVGVHAGPTLRVAALKHAKFPGNRNLVGISGRLDGSEQHAAIREYSEAGDRAVALREDRFKFTAISGSQYAGRQFEEVEVLQ